MSSKEKAVQIFRSVLKKIDPLELIPDIISADKDSITVSTCNMKVELSPGSPVFVIGCGKASANMAAALESVLDTRTLSGVIVTAPDPLVAPATIRVCFGSHPWPDETSLKASEQLLNFTGTIPEGAAVINLLSGGASSLFCKPADGLTIQHLAETYKLLVISGASIGEINTVRKAISSVKGGQLLQKLAHTRLTDLIISDVPDDDPKDIGSGPTTAQFISFTEAESVLNRYNLLYKIPGKVKRHIKKGNETEKRDGMFRTDDIPNHKSCIISSAKIAAREAAKYFEDAGYNAFVEPRPWSGPIKDFEKYITGKISGHNSETGSPAVYILYGECTVHVTGPGKGGRNQELALRMAKKLNGLDKKITFLSAGTDGIDGPTDAAGAVVNHKSYSEAIKEGINPGRCLENSDSYSFFEQAGGHIKTGPTGNNVMDLQFLLIE